MARDRCWKSATGKTTHGLNVLREGEDRFIDNFIAKEQKKKRERYFALAFPNSFNTSFPTQNVSYLIAKFRGRLFKTGAQCV